MPQCSSHARSSERAFGVVEVIVAVVLLSIVVTGAVLATGASERSGMRNKAVADMNAIAERAFERAHGDLTARSFCENAGAGWRAAAATHARSGSSAAASFQACTPPAYTDFTDEQGRNFTVRVTIQPVDLPSDGTGANDADNNFRDDYKVSTNVSLAGDSRVGLETIEPLVVNGSLDWQEANSDMATVRVYACGINRADRSLTVGGCAVSDGTRTPLGNLRIGLAAAPATNWNPATDSSITTASNGVGEAIASVEPGSYRMVAPQTFTDRNNIRWNLMRVDPAGLQVSGSGRYDVNVTYVRHVTRTINFCTQIMTAYAKKDGETFDDGFEAYSTNVNYRSTGSPAYRSVRIDSRRDRRWACSRVTAQPGTTDNSQAWVMYDPLSYNLANAGNADQPVPIGRYDLEIEQNYGDYRNSNRFGMRVDEVAVDCSNNLAWNRALDGTPVPVRPRDPLNDRPLAADETAPWLGRYDLRDDRSHRICIRLEPKTLDRDRCTGPNDPNGAYKKGAPRTVPNNAEKTGKCFYWKTECVEYCPDGARICVANCNYKWKGSTSAVMEGEAAKPFGGPADPTVGCRPRQRGAYQWYGWSPGVIWEGQVGQSTPESKWKDYQWVGGGSYYYNNYSGHYSSGPVFYCQDIAFAASSRYLCHQGNNTPVSTSNGFVYCRYHFGDCIQAELPQYPGVYVRGIMRDVSVNYEKPIIPNINALRYLTIVNGIDKPETINGWNPGTWWDSLDIKIRKVSGDPSCGDDGVENTWPRWDDVDPVMEDIWYRIVDEPELRNPASRNPNGNTGSDRVAI